MAEMIGVYSNEKKYQKVKSKLKNIGKILLIIGAILLAIGITLIIVGSVKTSEAKNQLINTATNQSTTGGDESIGGFVVSGVDDLTVSNTHNSAEKAMRYFASGGVLSVIGFALLVYGIIAMIIAYRREIASYFTSSVMPVVNDATNYLADNTAPAVGRGLSKIAEGVSYGIATGKAKVGHTNCPKCGETLKKDAAFCSKCGTRVEVDKVCANCGSKVELSEAFCSKCGTPTK